jgi:hypothetical protein
MSGPKRTPDKLNIIGIVVVGVCSAVLVYVSIVALQAFYMDDTSEIQMMADYGGQDTQARTIKAEQSGAINRASIPNPAPKTTTELQTYRIPIKVAMEKVVAEGKKNENNGTLMLIPAYGPSKCRTTEPEFGRPKPDVNKQCPDWGKAEPTAPAPAPAPTPTPTPTGGTGPGGGPPPGGQPGTTNNPKGDGR